MQVATVILAPKKGGLVFAEGVPTRRSTERFTEVGPCLPFSGHRGKAIRPQMHPDVV